MKIKSVAFCALTLGAGLALAAFWGPFNVTKVQPNIASFSDDAQVEYAGSRTTPRLYLNVDVQKIKRGDIVRVVYASGEVYDMEAGLQCSYAASPSCTWKKMTKKASVDSNPTVSSVERAKRIALEKDTCRQDSRVIDIPTYRWEVSYPDTGTFDVVSIQARYLFTGYVSEVINGGGCK